MLLLEKAAVHGGTSSMSGGHFYLGGGTAVQQATGHEDSVDAMARYLMASTKDPDEEKIRAYCEGSVEHFDWLEALGFEFERSFFPGKAVIQPGTEGLMYTGNEKVWPFREEIPPAPRGHKVPVPGDTEGTKIVMDLLRDRVEEAGVEVRFETGATNLVVTDDGAVAGVAWKRFDETGVVRRRRGRHRRRRLRHEPRHAAEHTPAIGTKLFVLGGTYDDGLGIRLGAVGRRRAREHGRAVHHRAVLPALVAGEGPDRQQARASGSSRRTATTRGRRTSCCSSRTPRRTSSPTATTWRSSGCRWSRSRTATRPSRRWRPALELPEGSLVATMARYNEHAARGEDPDFHKHPDWLAPQTTGPWGVYDLTLGTALYAGFTLGGMRTGVDGEVLREDRSVIPGLYAAGACASNIAQDGAGYCSGTQLGEGSFFGRRAGVAAQPGSREDTVRLADTATVGPGP